MTRRIQIYVPGINTWPGDSRNWDGRAVTHTHTESGFRAEKVEYWCGPISRALGQKRRALKLYRTLKRYTHAKGYSQRVIVAHSNGADVTLTMVRDYLIPRIDELHLVCAATEASFKRNWLNHWLRSGQVGKVFVYVAGKDWALHLAKLRPARWLGYGTLGLHGPLHVAKDIASRVKVIKDGPWENYGHSDCWADEVFEQTMQNFLT